MKVDDQAITDNVCSSLRFCRNRQTSEQGTGWPPAVVYRAFNASQCNATQGKATQGKQTSSPSDLTLPLLRRKAVVICIATKREPVYFGQSRFEQASNTVRCMSKTSSSSQLGSGSPSLSLARTHNIRSFLSLFLTLLCSPFDVATSKSVRLSPVVEREVMIRAHNADEKN